ncbi:MAG: hypothetical protein JWN95_2143 [Frankiales bacterium]|nr:hypothetical protein [Frankiales bacterium]
MSENAATASTTPAASTPAVTALVEQNLPLVGHLVRETMTRLPAHVNRDDLVSAGMTALVLAARSFQEGRGVPFARFAAIRIRGALVDELRNMDWASRSVRGRARELETTRAHLTSSLGRSPKPQELANTLGLSVSELDAIDADVQRASILSLQGFAPETGAALMPDTHRGPEQLLLDREQIGYLHDAITELPDRLQFVVRAYFFEQRQMSDIATELGVTESRISQLRAEALKMLKHGINAQYTDTPTTPTDTTRTATKLATYAATIATRSTLTTRLHITTPMAETHPTRTSAVA